MFYEGVRFIVFVVAVQRDRIYKKEHNQKLRRPIWALKNVLLTMKQLSLDTVHEMNLLKNELVLHLSLTKNVDLRLNLAFLAKD